MELHISKEYYRNDMTLKETIKFAKKLRQLRGNVVCKFVSQDVRKCFYLDNHVVVDYFLELELLEQLYMAVWRFIFSCMSKISLSNGWNLLEAYLLCSTDSSNALMDQIGFFKIMEKFYNQKFKIASVPDKYARLSSAAESVIEKQNEKTIDKVHIFAQSLKSQKSDLEEELNSKLMTKVNVLEVLESMETDVDSSCDEALSELKCNFKICDQRDQQSWFSIYSSDGTILGAQGNL